MKKSTLLQFLGFPCCDSYVTSEDGSGLKFDFSKSNTDDCNCSNDRSNAKSKGMISIAMLFVLFLFSNFSMAQTITVDGNPIDWDSANFNAFLLKSYTLDPSGTGVVDNQFTSSKDFFLAGGSGQGYLGWVLGQTKAKNDIANAAAVLKNGILYFAGDRTSNNGAAQIGFWFLLNGTAPIPGGTFAPPHVRGDLLILADFSNGGSLATVSIYRWIGGGTPSPGSSVVPNTDGNLETTNLLGTVAINNNNTFPIPVGWTFLRPTYQTNEFYEGQVDLTTLGLDNTCFASFILEARASPSVTASLDDFAGGIFNVKPIATINNVTVCSGGSATFTATGTGGIAPLTYSFNGGPYTSSNTYTINPATASTTVSVVVRGAGPNFCESDSASGTLTVNAVPSCSITGPASVCPNSTSNNYSGPSGTGFTYLWSISGNGSISGSLTGPSVSVTAGTGCGQDYTLTLIVNNGICSSTCTKTVSVVDTTPPTFTFCPPGSELGCNPSGVPAPGAATATDNCGTPTITSALGTITSNGCSRSQTRTYTATDRCGLTTTCQQVFTWTVVTAPVLAGVPAGGALGCNPTPPSCSQAVTASNQCGSVNVTCIPGSITSEGCNRSQTFTYSAESCGLSSSATVSYTWTADTTRPVISTTATSGALGCNPTVVAPTFTVKDECNPNAIVSVSTDGPTGQRCAKSQTWTATYFNTCWTSESVSITYTWTETLPLVINSPDSTIISSCDYTDQAAVDAAFATWISQFSVTGGCDPVGDYGTPTAPLVCTGGTTTVTYIVTDICSTPEPVIETFTVNRAPVLNVNCPQARVVECGQDANAAFIEWRNSFGYTGGCASTVTATDVTQYQMPEPGQPLVITFTVTDNCQTASCSARFYINPCALCTYTQGAYGTEGGAMCDGTFGGLSTAEMITQILNSTGTITVGKTGRSIVMNSPSAVDCIIERLPGGGPSKELIAGNFDICTLPGIYLRKGIINNSLLAQTITLSLNVGIGSSDLSSFELQAGTMATANPQGGCGSSTPTERVCGYYNESGVWVNTTNEYTYRTISAAVVNAITPNGSGDRTVAGLIDLANRALGNTDGIVGTEGGVSLSAITSAVDAINNVFDECKVFVGWNVAPCAAANATSAKNQSVISGLSVVAYPNPFADNFKIDVKTSSDKDLNVKVYDMIGRLLQTNNVKVTDVETFEVGANYPSGVYNVIVTQGTEVKTQRVIKR